MSMRFALLLHTLVHHVLDVAASRVRIQKVNRTDDLDFSDSGTTASCLYECGAREVSVEWEKEDESDGSTHSMSSTFMIGEGSRIKYKPTNAQCLSRCQVVDVNSRHPCGNLYKSNNVYKNSIKVSKNAEYKLCCVPRDCKYNPKDEVYEPHQEGDGWWRGLRPYKPLTEIKTTFVAARTCLCCKQEREKMKWDSRVKRYCKEAYTVSKTGNAVRGLTRLITVKTSDVIHRARCRSYCSNYPDYPFAMRSKEQRSLVAHAVKASRSPNEVKDEPDDGDSTSSTQSNDVDTEED